jgi:hypothetical protein
MIYLTSSRPEFWTSFNSWNLLRCLVLVSVETRATFLNVVRSISYQSESNDSPVQQRSGDAAHFSSDMLDPFSRETEFGVFVHSFGDLGKDVVT